LQLHGAARIQAGSHLAGKSGARHRQPDGAAIPLRPKEFGSVPVIERFESFEIKTPRAQGILN